MMWSSPPKALAVREQGGHPKGPLIRPQRRSFCEEPMLVVGGADCLRRCPRLAQAASPLGVVCSPGNIRTGRSAPRPPQSILRVIPRAPSMETPSLGSQRAVTRPVGAACHEAPRYALCHRKVKALHFTTNMAHASTAGETGPTKRRLRLGLRRLLSTKFLQLVHLFR